MTQVAPRPYREFGSWLRARRLARRWTQDELATRLSYDVTYVRKIEWGARKATEAFRARLADAFELPVESLPDPDGARAAVPTLPVPVTTIVGRGREIAEVVRLLESARLVTLVGAPGIGKTRLAVEIAARLDDTLEHGARFASLLTARDRGDVAVAVGSALGLAVAGAPGPETLLADHLRHQELLLVLDNFEHVASAAPLVAFLLAEAPALRVLTTSREPLRVSGETQYPVPPLAFAGTDAPAVRLFVQRPKLVNPAFTLRGDQERVTRICERLDGVPLAIELAAAASRVLSPAELLAELDHVLNLPTQGPRDAPFHQHTLRAAIDWSYRLLDDERRALLARLGVFVGGFTLESASAVCGGGASDRPGIVAGVTSLVSKSLLEMRTDAAGRSRAIPLEAIREYALERLDERRETVRFRRRHAVHFADVADTAQPHLTGKEQARWLDVLGEEHGNLTAALRWAVREEPGTALRLAGALWRFWLLRGYFTEGRQWLEQVLGQGADDDPLRVRAATGAGVLARTQGDYERADQLFDDAATLARRLGSREELALALLNGGIVAENRGRYDQAKSLFEQSLALYREVGSQRGVGHALNDLGNVALDGGDIPAATAFFEQALAAFRSLEDDWSIAIVSTNLGWVAQTTGETVAAKTWYGRTLALHRALGNERGIANTLCNLGRVARMEDDSASARAYLEEALLLFRRLGERPGVAESLDELAAIAAHDRELGRAARLYSASAALRDVIGIPLPPAEADGRERVLEAVRSGLGEREFDQAWIDGRAMSTDDAVSLALRRVESAGAA